jgi:polyribonucleotide nucleotidyltransferase
MTLRHQITIGTGSMIVESGKIAKQADGSCVIRLGDTVVLSTACAQKGASGRDFLPLTVDYRENTYAGGRIPGGFFKREGRPSEKEILTCRMTDRPLRPLFPEGYNSETQVISLVLSADGENDPDILAINGASTALILSDIPFYTPIGAVRVGLIEGNVVFNPTNSERDVSELDLIVVGTSEAVVMVEAAANQLSEETLLDCIFQGHQEIQKVVDLQVQMQQEAGIEKPEWKVPESYSNELFDQVKSDLEGPLGTALHTAGKFERRDAVAAVVDPYLEQIRPEDEEKSAQVRKIIKRLEEDALRRGILQSQSRFDGRQTNDIRKIDVEVGLLPRTHGSALFTRGETQALVTATLGTSRDAQIIEEYEGESRQKFILHYSFPPFSVGEVKFLRGPGRREIGHGVLARRALTPLLPHEEDFPYTVRVVSDILESNGSSSMASVCGGSLALFDAGVPMLAPVAGVAMGLIKTDDSFAVLSDIAGQEDHYGDMDFKVAGTRDGVTALQMDIKIAGVTREIMKVALEQAREGRFHILDIMDTAIETPRTDISEFAPRLHTIFVAKDKIRDIIGPGGKTIRSITEETGCEIEIDNDGKVTIASPDGIAAKRAREIIERLTETPEVGKVYDAGTLAETMMQSLVSGFLQPEGR